MASIDPSNLSLNCAESRSETTDCNQNPRGFFFDGKLVRLPDSVVARVEGLLAGG